MSDERGMVGLSQAVEDIMERVSVYELEALEKYAPATAEIIKGIVRIMTKHGVRHKDARLIMESVTANLLHNASALLPE